MKTRISNIEFLRILSMIMIVISHISLYTNWEGISNLSPYSTVRLLGFDILGPIGAVLFFMIPGFFARDYDVDKAIYKSLYKIKSVWIKTFLYSVCILFICYLLSLTKIGLKKAVVAFFPFSFNEYWFVTAYILLILSSPFINYILFKCSEQQTNYLAFILFLLLFLELVNNSLVSRYFLALEAYIIGFKINFYRKKVDSYRKTIWFSLIAFCLIDLCTIYFSRAIGMEFSHSAHFTQYVLAVVIATFIFTLFSVTQPIYSKIINILAKGMFAVYLVTSNPNFQDYFYNSIIRISRYQDKFYLPLVEVLVTILICIFFGLLDVCLTSIFKFFTIKSNNNYKK